MSDYSYLWKRENPFYSLHKETWERSWDAYSGGSDYIDLALIKHISEVDVEFAERRRRAYYFNYPRKIARLITQYVLSEEPRRRNAAPELEEDFSRSGLRTNEVMRQFSTMLNVYGEAWLLVDMPEFSGEIDPERQKRERIRPYALALSPLAVVDWSYGEDGALAWAVVAENGTYSPNPFLPPVRFSRRRLWTRDGWFLFERENETGMIFLKDSAAHKLGRVPLIRGIESDGFGMDANHWFEDAVRISDAILNNESEAQMNAVKQMFGLLVISESFARSARANTPDSSSEPGGGKFSHILARSAAIWESNEEKGISRYISPSGIETQAIRAENLNLKKELFDVIGLAVQKDSAAEQTAESKAWDHQNVKQFLVSRADILEQTEQMAWGLMHCWDRSVEVPEIVYNRDFAVTELKSSVEALLGLEQISRSGEFSKEIARSAVGLLEKVNRISPAARRKILEEIDHA